MTSFLNFSKELDAENEHRKTAMPVSDEERELAPHEVDDNYGKTHMTMLSNTAAYNSMVTGRFFHL